MEILLVQLSMADEAALVLGRRVIQRVSPHQQQAFDFVAGRRLGLEPMRPEGGRREERSLIRLLLPACAGCNRRFGEASGPRRRRRCRAPANDKAGRLSSRRRQRSAAADGQAGLASCDQWCTDAGPFEGGGSGFRGLHDGRLGPAGMIRMQTAACNTNPNLSTRTCCFSPVTFLPAS